MRIATNLFIASVLIVFGVQLWEWVGTWHIMKQRDHTFDVMNDMRRLANAVVWHDAALASEDKPSIFPKDLGFTDARDYISYLERNSIIDEPLSTLKDIQIANVARGDTDSTIFLLSRGTMRDIHTMIHNIGGVPDYDKGFISIRRNREGQFYSNSSRNDISLIGTDPPRQPAFLK